MEILLPITLSLIIIFLILAILRTRSTGRQILPGPPGLPLIGNSHQFHPTNLHLRLTNLSKKYGPLMFMNVIGKPILIISSAKVAKQALKDNDVAFSGRPDTVTIKTLTYNNLDIITSTYGPYWREVRKLSVLHLFTPKQVRSFQHVRKDEVSIMVKQISRKADSGQVIDLNEALVTYSSRLICRVAFGKKDVDTGRFSELLHNLQSMLIAIFWADCSPLLGWLDRITGNTSRLEEVFKDVDSFCQKLVDEHLDPNRPESMNGDILDMLIQLRDEKESAGVIDWDHIKALLLNVFVAGTDTTSTTLVWAMTALAMNPNMMKTAQTEIRNLVGDKGTINEDDLEKLPYLKAILKETFRLYPATPLGVPRVVIEKCTINGCKIQPKTMVYINEWAIGRDPEYWENPDEFSPKRFLNNDIDFKGHDFGLLPFGSGRRICPGMSLGVVTVELALANLLYSFDWQLPDGAQKEDIDTNASQGFVLFKTNPLCLMATNYV